MTSRNLGWFIILIIIGGYSLYSCANSELVQNIQTGQKACQWYLDNNHWSDRPKYCRL